MLPVINQHDCKHVSSLPLGYSQLLTYFKAEDQAVAMESFLETVDRLAKAKDPFKLTADIDSFSKVSKETKQLVEIVDIQDELDIIKLVLTAQKRVLEQLRGVVSSPDRSHPTEANAREAKPQRPAGEASDSEKTPGNTAFKSARAVDQALRIVKDNIARVEEMTNSAKRIPDGVREADTCLSSSTC